MSLLPKNHQEFRQKEYWDSFFKKRGKKGKFHVVLIPQSFIVINVLKN